MESNQYKRNQPQTQQFKRLILIDELSNVEYVIEVEEETYNRAHEDITFASMLLEKAKTFSKSKHSSTLITFNEPSCSKIINNKPSCSKTNTVVQFDDNLMTSDIENCDQDETNMSNLEQNDNKWSHKAILLLISLYKENVHMLEKVPQKKMWIKISESMQQEKYKFTVTQLYNKMDTLKRRYRQIVDHNAQSGNDRKEWIYLDLLNEIFYNKPWIKPLSVAGSNIQEANKSLFDDDNKTELPTKQSKISLNKERAHYLQESLNEKRLKRQEANNYREKKLKILKELQEALSKKN